MKLVKCPSQVIQKLTLDGIIDFQFEHEVKQTRGTAKVLTPNLPKISGPAWQQLCAFFEWSYEHTHSEAQARLFLNQNTMTIAAWVFPQISGTGMTTKECPKDSEERIRQRAQFPDSEGWMPFGTVHHHCKCGAFQSGTDESDERAQDGLHITVGNLGESQYSIHCRFYVSGNQFNPDMSWFYDISEAVNDMPEWCAGFLREEWRDEIARSALCRPPPKDTCFPEEWKTNLITEEKVKEKETRSVEFPWKSNIGEKDAWCYDDYEIARAVRKLMAQPGIEDEEGALKVLKELQVERECDDTGLIDEALEIGIILGGEDCTLERVIEYLEDEKKLGSELGQDGLAEPEVTGQ